MKRGWLILTLATGLVAGYLVFIASLWAIEAANMRNVTQDLSETLAAEQAKVDQLSADVESLAIDVETNLDAITGIAHDRAAAQDNELLLGDVGFALNECASEREELADVIATRYLYVISSIRVAEKDINAYCGEVHDMYVTLTTDEGGL